MPDWPHSPPHRFFESGTYMITAGTYRKVHIFKTPDHLNIISGILFKLITEFNFEIQAWALMSNHYHFIVCVRKSPEYLPIMLKRFHGETSLAIKDFDKTLSRRIWFQYWDSHITYPKSYFARLNYVHNNPSHHKIVTLSENYDWCSAKWFKLNSSESFRKTIWNFKLNNVRVYDDY